MKFWFFSPTQRKSELCIAISGVQVQGRWGSGRRGVGGEGTPSRLFRSPPDAAPVPSLACRLQSPFVSDHLVPSLPPPAVCGSISFSRTPVTGPPTQASLWPPVKLPVFSELCLHVDS